MKPDGKGCRIHRIELGGKERELAETAIYAHAAGSVLTGVGTAALGIGVWGFLAAGILGSAWYIGSKLENPLDPNNAGGKEAADLVVSNLNEVPPKISVDDAPTRDGLSVLDMDGRTIHGQYVYTSIWRLELKEMIIHLADEKGEWTDAERDDFKAKYHAPQTLNIERLGYQVQIRLTAARRRTAGYLSIGIVQVIGYALEGEDYYTRPQDAAGYVYDPLLDLAAYRVLIQEGKDLEKTALWLGGDAKDGFDLEKRQRESPPLQVLEYVSDAGQDWSTYGEEHPGSEEMTG